MMEERPDIAKRQLKKKVIKEDGTKVCDWEMFEKLWDLTLARWMMFLQAQFEKGNATEFWRGSNIYCD